jgi:hypothetical protein
MRSLGHMQQYPFLAAANAELASDVIDVPDSSRYTLGDVLHYSHSGLKHAVI